MHCSYLTVRDCLLVLCLCLQQIQEVQGGAILAGNLAHTAPGIEHLIQVIGTRYLGSRAPGAALQVANIILPPAGHRHAKGSVQRLSSCKAPCKAPSTTIGKACGRALSAWVNVTLVNKPT